jgi:hypothetical protein
MNIWNPDTYDYEYWRAITSDPDAIGFYQTDSGQWIFDRRLSVASAKYRELGPRSADSGIAGPMYLEVPPEIVTLLELDATLGEENG